MKGEVELMKRILELRLQDEKDQWVRTVAGYLYDLKLTKEQLRHLKKVDIKNKIQEYGNTK